jgi:dihydrofolate reductase
MAKVSFNMSVSLDGFVAGPNNEIDQVFAWYGAGDTEVQLPGAAFPFRISAASARHLAASTANVGALITGRRTFDLTQGWGGHPPLGVPCVVLTHKPAEDWVKDGSPFTFVTGGIEAAIAKARELAEGKDVVLSTPSTLQQALRAGLVDEINIDLASVLIGQGIPLFGALDAPVRLERTGTVEGSGVTHLRFAVLK